MGSTPPPGYPDHGPHGAMGYPPHPPGMATPYPPYAIAAHPAHHHPAHYPGAGYYAPPAQMHYYYPPAGAYSSGQSQAAGMSAARDGHQAGHGMHEGMSQFVEEISNGGSGLSSLGKMLNLDDSEFWKGALIGAATVLLLTNESVQNTLFKTGAKAKEAVQSGVEKVKETASEIAEKAQEE